MGVEAGIVKTTYSLNWVELDRVWGAMNSCGELCGTMIAVRACCRVTTPRCRERPRGVITRQRMWFVSVSSYVGVFGQGRLARWLTARALRSVFQPESRAAEMPNTSGLGVATHSGWQ